MNIIKNINLFKSMAIVAIVTMLLPSLILCSKSSQRERIFPSRNINFRKLDFADYPGRGFLELFGIFNPNKSLVFEFKECMKIRNPNIVERQAIRMGLYQEEPKVADKVRYPSTSEFTALLGLLILEKMIMFSILGYIVRWVYDIYYDPDYTTAVILFPRLPTP